MSSDKDTRDYRLAVRLVSGCYQCPFCVTHGKQDEQGRVGLYEYCSKDRELRSLEGIMEIPEWCDLEIVKVPDIEEEFSRTRELVAKIKNIILTDGPWADDEMRVEWIIEKIRAFDEGREV